MNYFRPYVLFLILICLNQACKKNIQYDLKPILNATNDNILSQRPFNYAFIMLLKAIQDSTLQHTHHSFIDGATVYLNAGGNIITFIFDGDGCRDSVSRYGELVATLDTNFLLTGSKVRFSFTNYNEDTHQVSAVLNIINTGPDQYGKLWFTSLVDSAMITKDSIHNITYKGKMEYSFDPGILISEPENLLISITGTSSGISSSGNSFQSFIDDPLKDSICCPWINMGKIQIYITEGDVFSGTVEYISKTNCNDSMTYNFDGRLYHTRLKEEYLKN